jgi:hypothetical protein
VFDHVYSVHTSNYQMKKVMVGGYLHTFKVTADGSKLVELELHIEHEYSILLHAAVRRRRENQVGRYLTYYR